MKLLLVDDEDMTRNGLIQALDWSDIGITDIVQASDGLQGLDMVKEEHPQIILCDIRMPKMDGLTMLSKVYDLYPDIVFVLLTGHAEVEYLKKAIMLNVISFIEKPINLDDLTSALKKAVAKVVDYQRQQESAQIHSTVISSQLAYQLTFPYKTCRAKVDQLYDEFLKHYGTDKFLYVTTIVVRPEVLPDNTMLYTIGQKLHDRLLPGHYHVIYTDRSPGVILYQIYGSVRPVPQTLQMIGDILLSYYMDYTRCYVAVGKPVSGIQRAWLSCQDARAEMKYARFCEPNTILMDSSHSWSSDQRIDDTADVLHDNISSESDSETNDAVADIPRRFRTALQDRDQQTAMELLSEFRTLWYHSKNKDSLIKSTYYSMLIILNQMYHNFHIATDITLDHTALVMDSLDSAFSFLEVDDLLREKTEEFFSALSSHSEEDSTIFKIKEYINRHYMDQDLSVKSVSENVFLSVSYLCTYFKNETDTTLNQYITDFRVKKAMELLANTNMKIVDVANAVGYRDSNYFAKIFKKQTGSSPKEYKNRVL